jgi:hypothetical protein
MPRPVVSGGVDPRYFGGGARFYGSVVTAAGAHESERRVLGIGEGAFLGRAAPLLISAHEFAGVVTFERFGKVVEELQERGGIVIV